MGDINTICQKLGGERSLVLPFFAQFCCLRYYFRFFQKREVSLECMELLPRCVHSFRCNRIEAIYTYGHSMSNSQPSGTVHCISLQKEQQC